MLMFEFIKATRHGKSFVEHFLVAAARRRRRGRIRDGAGGRQFDLPAAGRDLLRRPVRRLCGLAAPRAARVVVAEPEPVVVAAPPRAEPVRVEPVRAEPVRVEPVRAEPARRIRSPASSLRRRPSLRRAPSRWSRSSPCKRSARELVSALPPASAPRTMKTRDFHLPGRSPVYAREGMAATSHPLASLAAIETLKGRRHRGRCRRRGGRGAVRGRAGDDRHRRRLLLPRGEAGPAGVGLQRLRPRGRGGRRPRSCWRRASARKIPATSPHAVTVPGAIEAWESILKAHGRFGLDRALQPAIRYAENGFPIAPRVGSDWADYASTSSSRMRARRNTICRTAQRRAIGSVMRLPALAATLKAIAAGGAKAFYEGAIAADIAATVQAARRAARRRGSRAPSRRRRRRRSRRIIAGSTWSSCRRTGRG